MFVRVCVCVAMLMFKAAIVNFGYSIRTSYQILGKIFVASIILKNKQNENFTVVP